MLVLLLAKRHEHKIVQLKPRILLTEVMFASGRPSLEPVTSEVHFFCAIDLVRGGKWHLKPVWTYLLHEQICELALVESTLRTRKLVMHDRQTESAGTALIRHRLAVT